MTSPLSARYPVQVAELEDLLEARVNAAPQFISLKDMLTKKNAKMKVFFSC